MEEVVEHFQAAVTCERLRLMCSKVAELNVEYATGMLQLAHEDRSNEVPESFAVRAQDGKWSKPRP